MIFNGIIDLFFNIFSYAASFLPIPSYGEFEILAGIGTVFNDVRTALRWVNYFFPVDLLFHLVSASVALIIALAVIRVFMYMARFARG